ncbi:MAG: hypothetical protein QM594_16970 [Niabella sp.]
MRSILTRALLLAIIFTACKSKSADTGGTPQTASEYYEKIIELEETMSEPLLTTEAAIKARGDKQDFEGIARSAKAMEDTIDIRINAIKKMKPVGHGAEDFKIVVTRYFEYIKSIYTAYRTIGEAKTEEERMKAADKMANTINGQEAVMANLQAAQAQFAASNHFTIDAR